MRRPSLPAEARFQLRFRRYLHAYSDALPDAQFVHVQLHHHAELQGVGVTFSLQRPAGIPAAQWRLSDSHFRRPKLIARYDDLGNDEVAEMLLDGNTYLDAGGTDARAFLLARAADRKIRARPEPLDGSADGLPRGAP